MIGKRYTARATVSLKQAGLDWKGVEYTERSGDYADLETIKSPKKHYNVKIQYVCYDDNIYDLRIINYEESSIKMLYSFITLNNRRIILKKYAGYDRYRRML